MHDDDLERPDGADADDQWSRYQGGFRIDYAPSAVDSATLQGDVYHGQETLLTSLSGADLVARWNHQWASGSSLQVQAYVDHIQRGADLTGGVPLWVNTFDLDMQHNFTLGRRNTVVWGAGLRISRYRIDNTPSLLFEPPQRTLDLSNLFVQDTYALTGSAKVIAGLKLENDPYSGPTLLPNLRISWAPTQNGMVWAAVSRAIRSPTPFDVDVLEKSGSDVLLKGDPDFRTEKLTAFETGGRLQLSDRASISVSGFYNLYHDIRSIEVQPVVFYPLQWGNGIEGHAYGVDAWGGYQAASWWRLSAGVSLLRQHLKFKPGASAPFIGTAQAGDDPEAQLVLRSFMNLGPRVTLDTDLRHVSALPDPHVPAYTEMDARLGWNVTRRLRLSLSGLNLIHSRHLENPAAWSAAVPRSVYADLRLRF